MDAVMNLIGRVMRMPEEKPFGVQRHAPGQDMNQVKAFTVPLEIETYRR